VNEAVDATGCGGTADCQQGEVCLTHYLWCDLSDQIHGFLSQISLSNLVERREVQHISARQTARSHQGATLALTEI
jgi:Rrf2 family transcriptional regulator, iron-sulfur cluster assembly transcription factor